LPKRYSNQLKMMMMNL